MYKVVEARRYNPSVTRLAVEAPLAARRAKPGQFVMLRATETGERIPLTIAGADKEAGTVTVIFQEVGKSTKLLGALRAGDSLADLAGPLGTPAHLEEVKSACVVGGGLGCAVAYPQAKALYDQGARVDMVAGFRSGELIFMEEDMAAVSDSLTVCTDDGSNGHRGLVTDILRGFLEEGRRYDRIIAIGPLPMMKFVTLTAQPYGVPVTVSLNPVMVDGTGMCGGCRVTVGGRVRFACVDGPDFDGYQVDFDEVMRRNRMYADQEARALAAHVCQLGGQAHV
jgi:ferredoxin--NADP+ reductase